MTGGDFHVYCPDCDETWAECYCDDNADDDGRVQAMSDYRMIYLVGAPGSGKTTLMRRLTHGFDRLPCDIPVPHDQLIESVTGVVTHAEIGRQRGDFSGTDALASSIITRAEPWILSRPYPVVLGEGARLGNHRFLEAATESYDVVLAVLDHDDAEGWREIRSKQLGKFQNAGWVKGRLTASRNLADNPPDGVTVLRGHPDDLYLELGNFAGVKPVAIVR